MNEHECAHEGCDCSGSSRNDGALFGVTRRLFQGVSGRIIRFAAWWTGTAALLNAPVCPLCGKAGCPTSGAFAVVIATLLAGFMDFARNRKGARNKESSEKVKT